MSQLLRRFLQQPQRAARGRWRLPRRLPGLRAQVDVRYDAYDVPHLYAKSRHDLFLAQGYLTARERLFQMDYNRHAAAGRLCELVGERKLPWRELTVHLKGCTTLDVDVLLRTFGLRAAAEASLEQHSLAAHEMMAAYTQGVNAAIRKGRALEHRLLRVRPRPWEEAECLLMLKAVAFELNFAWRAILLGAQLAEAQVPDRLARVMWPHVAQGTPESSVVPEWSVPAQELLALRQVASAGLGLGNAPGAGSNCFAVAGARSADGTGLLANDTHLPPQAPAVWHEIGLHAEDLDLQGFALPGVPGLALGRSDHHAWGITAGLVHDLDLFVERLNPDNPGEVLTPEGYAPLQRREEVFAIRGTQPVRRWIETSRHGPLLGGVATRPPQGHRLAIQWTGRNPGRELDALVGMWTARTPEEAGEALQLHGCPTYNISYADRAGRIAYFLAGEVPGRRPNTPVRPLEGWTRDWDWDERLPAAANPQRIDPPEGFLVTANHRIVPQSAGLVLGDLFEPPGRFLRITQLLREAGPRIGLDDLQRIQNDTQSQWGMEMTQALWTLVCEGSRDGSGQSDGSSDDAAAGGLGGADAWAAGHPERAALAKRAAEVWAAWDGNMAAYEPGAAICLLTVHEFAMRTISSLAGESAALAFVEMNSLTCDALVHMTREPSLFSAHGIDLAAAARGAFAAAVDALAARGGEAPEGWRWGDWHQWVGRHRLHHNSVGRALSLGPFAVDGGPDTPRRGDMNPTAPLRVAASMRWVASTGRPEAGRSIMPGGQSGQPYSPHYDDQLDAYLRGRLKAAPLHRSGQNATRTERLLPG